MRVVIVTARSLQLTPALLYKAASITTLDIEDRSSGVGKTVLCTLPPSIAFEVIGMAQRVMRFLLERRWVVRSLRAVYMYFFEEISRIRKSNPEVREIVPLAIRPSGISNLRINLLLPGISERHVFGGISTALEFLEGFRDHAENFRIIVTDESRLADAEHARFPGWVIGTLDDPDQTGRRILPVEDREDKALWVGERDVFVATSWWTAHLAREILVQQHQIHPVAAPRFIYLIQDFEPGFYPWSARYVLAQQTYRDDSAFVPVFNSRLLKDYLVQHGYVPAESLYFDPVINSGVAHTLRERQPERIRQVLVYGRPSVERNAFPLVVMALRHLVANYEVADWHFVSVGEAHAPVALGNDQTLSSLGKLSIEEYGNQLGRSYAGLSLMVSPHPSYPPLEMAAAGMRVVTNGFGDKDLSEWAENIVSVADPNPAAIAMALWEQLSSFGAGSVEGGSESEAFLQFLNGVLDFSGIAEQALRQISQPVESVSGAASATISVQGNVSS